MNDVEVRVHRKLVGKKFEPAFLLYSWPSMRLHEDGSRWIAKLARRGSENHQRNQAYAIAYWHTYCIGIGLDYRRATYDDFFAFQVAMAEVVSDQTGGNLEPGTIEQRMKAVVAYYESGEKAGWNKTAVDLKHALLAAKAGSAPTEKVYALPIDSSAEVPLAKRFETDVCPLSPNDLMLVLDELGPNESENSLEPKRDRIIAEWLVNVGLRLSEVVGSGKRQGLGIKQFSNLHPDPRYPFEHSIVRVFGKGSKFRSVRVPNWLIAKTKLYISSERANAVAQAQAVTSKLFVGQVHAAKAYRGRPITGRRFEKIFESACVRAGLFGDMTFDDRDLAGEKARHSPHDLRHTYAIATYYAELALGNSEPWKLIQAQLGHRKLTTTIETYLNAVNLMTQWGRDLRRMSVRELAGLPRG